MNWTEIKDYCIDKVKQLDPEYLTRLEYEILEIEKQGANNYWVENYELKKTWDHNKNGLVLPFLLEMTPIDPIIGINKLMIEDPNGVDMDSIIICLEDGNEVCVSKDTLIETNIGFIKAIDLTIDHNIL